MSGDSVVGSFPNESRQECATLSTVVMGQAQVHVTHSLVLIIDSQPDDKRALAQMILWAKKNRTEHTGRREKP